MSPTGSPIGFFADRPCRRGRDGVAVPCMRPTRKRRAGDNPFFPDRVFQSVKNKRFLLYYVVSPLAASGIPAGAFILKTIQYIIN